MISVIITTHNRKALLKRAVDSVLNQTYKDFELIVVDDSSTDGTEPFGEMRYFKLPENKGCSYARNYGYEQSKGEYIVFVDDDNEFLPDFLKESEYLLRMSSPQAGGVKVGRIIKYKDFEDYAIPYTHTGFESIDWGILMKREVMEKVKYDPLINSDSDADFGIEFAKHYTLIPLDKPLQVAHAENDEDSLCFPTEKRLKELEYFLEKHQDDYVGHPNELRYIYRLAGRSFYRGGHRVKGLLYFLRSFLAQPNWRSLKHLLIILQGWDAYDRFMTREEKKAARVPV